MFERIIAAIRKFFSIDAEPSRARLHIASKEDAYNLDDITLDDITWNALLERAEVTDNPEEAALKFIEEYEENAPNDTHN